MTTQLRNTATQHLRRTGTLHGWLGMVVKLMARIPECLESFTRRASTRSELAALDEHALKDIGLSRNDLTAIASGMFFADSTRRQRGPCASNNKGAHHA